MPLHHRVLAWSYQPARLVKTLGRPIGLASRNRLRVLLYHDVGPDEIGRFQEQLRWLARIWRFVTPAQFAAMVDGSEPIRGSNLLVTFDDGFASNRELAERVLNPMSIRALFFVVSEFVGLTDPVEARRFIAQNIYPTLTADEMPAHWLNMTWSDLAALSEQGHVIGAHTRTHARLSTLTSVAQLEDEIAGGADAIEKRLGSPVDHFAYTFGDINSFSAAALDVARRRFRYVYSGLRGDNAGGVPAFAIRRDSATPRDSSALLGAFLEGLADFHYSRPRELLTNGMTGRP